MISEAGVMSLKGTEVYFSGFLLSGFVSSGENEAPGPVRRFHYGGPLAGNCHSAVHPEDSPEAPLLHKEEMTPEMTDVFPTVRDDKLPVFIEDTPFAVLLYTVQSLIGNGVDVILLRIIPIYFHKMLLSG